MNKISKVWSEKLNVVNRFRMKESKKIERELFRSQLEKGIEKI